MKHDKNPKDFSVSQKSQGDFLGIKFNPGAVIDTPGSTEKARTISFRNRKPITDFSKCTKCAKCWYVCPDMAFTKQKDGTFLVIENNCKGCGICANECPVKCIDMEVVEH